MEKRDRMEAWTLVVCLGLALMGALGADMVWPLVGHVGRALSDLRPGGSAEFRDETLNGTRAVSVVTDGSYVRAGDDVIVTESRGSRVVVRAANGNSLSTS